MRVGDGAENDHMCSPCVCECVYVCGCVGMDVWVVVCGWVSLYMDGCTRGWVVVCVCGNVGVRWCRLWGMGCLI